MAYDISLTQLFDVYLSANPGASRSAISETILEDYPELRDQISHRTLRHKLSKYVRGDKGSRTVTLTSPPPNNPTKGTSAEDPGLDQKISFQSTGESPISLEEAITRFQIDTDRYFVRQYWVRESVSIDKKTGEAKTTTWRYTLHVSKKPQETPDGSEATLQELSDILRDGLTFSPVRVKAVKDRTGVVMVADIHSGAKVDLSKHNPEFTYSVIIQKLDNIASQVNSMGFSRIVLGFLGDMIDTFSGLNHPDSWVEIHGGGKGMGAQAVMTTYRILMNFISKIHNLQEVVMVSGNHDRIGTKKADDPRGQVAELLAFMIAESTDIPVEYDPIIVSKPIDNINYLLTHMHLPLGSRPLSDIILEHGDSSRYNILVGGHKHRKSLKKHYAVEEQHLVDTKNYRAELVSPIFTGNFFSATLGVSTTAGFRIYERSAYADVPNSYDFTV